MSHLPHSSTKDKGKTNVFVTVTAFLIAVSVIVTLPLYFGTRLLSNPEIQRWLEELLKPAPVSLCPPEEIVEAVYSMQFDSLDNVTDKVYFHKNSALTYISGQESTEAEEWKMIYMQQLAYRLERISFCSQQPIDDEEIENALVHIGKSRDDFERLKGRIQRMGEYKRRHRNWHFRGC